MTTRSVFNENQIKQLEQGINREHVKQREQSGISLSYIEGWRCIDLANEIFGFGNWERRLISCEKVCEYTKENKYKKTNYHVGYTATVELIVFGEDGTTVTRHGTGAGSGIGQDLFDAYEGAIKEAETDAMKRAISTFGNRFGLSLYDKGRVQPEVKEKPKTQEEREADMKKWCNEKLDGIKSIDELNEFERNFLGSKIEKTMKEISENIYENFIQDLMDLKTNLKEKPNE